MHHFSTLSIRAIQPFALLFAFLGVFVNTAIYAQPRLYGGDGSIFSFVPGVTDPQVETYTLKALDGARPTTTRLLAFNGKMYGVTSEGGANDAGVIFEFDPVTKQFRKLRDFSVTEGSTPSGELTVFNSKLYGMTTNGGANNAGVIFEFDPAGSGTYTVKKHFDFSIGSFPYGSLTVYNGKLYGMAFFSGPANFGVLFMFDPSTNLYTIIKSFDNNDGGHPRGSLTIHNNKLYGVTSQGGLNNLGVLFSLDPATNTYARLKDFNTTEGSSPWGSLTFHNNKLYGMTRMGGTNNVGVIFEFDLSTNAYQKRKDLSTSEGSDPWGSLAVHANKLYGMTSRGGSIGAGVLFEFNPAGSGTYTKLKEFSYNTGTYPSGSLTVFADKLYGLTQYGGESELIPSQGVIFEYNPTEGTYTICKQFGYSEGAGVERVALLNNKLYGTTHSGGDNNLGVLFEYDLATKQYRARKHFSSNDGYDRRHITAFNSKLYGVTYSGGANGVGVLFEYDPAGIGTYTVKRHLSGETGYQPDGGLTVCNNKLYGTTTYVAKEGGRDPGLIFEYDPATDVYTKKKVFPVSGVDGSLPHTALTVYNNKLYGLASGNLNSWGTLFEFDPATNVYIVKKAFPQGGIDGNWPFSALTVLNNKLYGVSQSGGANGAGVLYEFNPATNTYTKLKDFIASEGGYPLGGLTVYNSKLYGVFSKAPITRLAYVYDLANSSFNVITTLPGEPIRQNLILYPENASCHIAVTPQASTSEGCVGNTISLTALASGGSSYSYTWQASAVTLLSSPATGSVVSATLLSGVQTITVTVTDGSCPVVASAVIQLRGKPMYTVNPGNWFDTEIWSCQREPLQTDDIILRHSVFVNPNYTGKARKITFEAGGQIWYGLNGRIQLRP